MLLLSLLIYLGFTLRKHFLNIKDFIISFQSTTFFANSNSFLLFILSKCYSSYVQTAHSRLGNYIISEKEKLTKHNNVQSPLLCSDVFFFIIINPWRAVLYFDSNKVVFWPFPCSHKYSCTAIEQCIHT